MINFACILCIQAEDQCLLNINKLGIGFYHKGTSMTESMPGIFHAAEKISF